MESMTVTRSGSTSTSGTTLANSGSSPASAETNPPGAAQQPVQVLGNLAQFQPGAELGTVSHYDVQPVLDIYANVEGTDLGTVTREMERIKTKYEKQLPRGSHMILRGQS